MLSDTTSLPPVWRFDTNYNHLMLGGKNVLIFYHWRWAGLLEYGIKNLKNKLIIQLAGKFLPCLRCFCLMQERVNAHTGRCQRICRTGHGVANTEVMWKLLQADSIYPVFPHHNRNPISQTSQTLNLMSSCSLPGRLLILFIVSNLYLLRILLHPRYDTWLTALSTDKN